MKFDDDLLVERNKITDIHGGLIIGGVAALALVLWFLLSCWKWKRVLNFFHKGTAGARRFEYRDLATATKNFSDDNKLGEGAFGVVYRGYLKQLDREVAVKKIVNELNVGHKDFFTEVITISEARHKNLVKFYGWCIRGHSWNIIHFMCGWFWNTENKELFLVHELMKNGNLHEYLHNSEIAAVQSWPTRIANPDNNAVLQTTVVGSAEEHVDVQTTAVGTEGYIDPQCKKGGKVRFNCPSNVYSFGIVLLEIACRGKRREETCGLYRNKGDVVEAADTRLEIGADFERREMERLIILGLWCSAFETQHRPTMQKAMDVLECNAPLPDHNFITNSALASSDHDASGASTANI
ncbi:hypothetical protein DAI22_04g014100 [Oryza sativa Japonica Group]|nr:hypothetical protein DAI22_04g014100 [Oryza sativa Japonica Group]